MPERLHMADTHDDVATMLAQFLEHAGCLPVLATKDALGLVRRYAKVSMSSYDETSELVVLDAYAPPALPGGEDTSALRIRRLMDLPYAALFLDEDTFLHFDTPIHAIRPNDDLMILRDSSPRFGVKHSVLLTIDRSPTQTQGASHA